MHVVRFGVSMEEELLGAFDRYLEEKGYASRSQALRDTIRRALKSKIDQDEEAQAVGVISYVYDHHKRRLSQRITTLGHSRLEKIISSLHVHLDAIYCLEVVITRGKVRDLKELADSIISMQGVEYGELMLTSVPENKL